METCTEKMAALMTVDDVGACIRVSRKAVYEMVYKGEIPGSCIVRLGRRLRFDADGIEKWIKENRGK